jgi:hypothetical protein
VPTVRGIGVGIALTAALAAGLTAAAPAAADTVTAPAVYVRLVNPDNLTVPLTNWQPLSATLPALGPYDIGVALQSTTATANRQAVEVDLAADPGGSPPSAWSDLAPYTGYCALRAGTPGSIQPTGAVLFYHGDGTYRLDVSMYTYAQYNAFPTSHCTGGPTTTVTLAVDAQTSAQIAGTPLVPRTTRRAQGVNGPLFTLPYLNQGVQWRCARNPVFGPAGGPVTGTTVTSGSTSGLGGSTYPVDESDAFTSPGRWACSAQALGGDNEGTEFGTPWATTAAVTIKGEYVRDQRRTRLRLLGHGHRMTLTVPALAALASAAARGRLTLTIDSARCTSFVRQTVRLRPVLRQTVRVDGHGRAVFRFRSPTAFGTYLGQVRFGGTALVLPGRDADMDLGVFSYGSRAHLTFVNPEAWSPC